MLVGWLAHFWWVDWFGLLVGLVGFRLDGSVGLVGLAGWVVHLVVLMRWVDMVDWSVWFGWFGAACCGDVTLRYPSNSGGA